MLIAGKSSLCLSQLGEVKIKVTETILIDLLCHYSKLLIRTGHSNT